VEDARLPDERILCVEDDATQRDLVAGILAAEQYRVTGAASAEEALALVERQDYDLVLCDYKLPGKDGMALLGDLRQKNLDLAFVMVTAYGTIARAVEAVRAGADDYLSKPFERGELLIALERTLRARRLRTENRRLSAALTERDRLVDLLGRAPSMQGAFRRMEKVAATDVPILVRGEPGTGKELAARALHALSSRRDGPFVVAHCAATPPTLLEAELFGGSGGRFAQAARGTIFLDEIVGIPMELQRKLLHALESGRITVTGSRRELAIDARLIAASSHELEAGVREGRFLQELFWRLAVVPITLPPLRERRADIPFLIEHFVHGAARRHRCAEPRFPSELTRALLDHPWPGNVRELADTIERLVLLAEDGVAATRDLPDTFQQAPSGSGAWKLPPAGVSWEEHERDALRQAMDYARGNRTRAARLLGLSYKAFLYRWEKREEQQETQG
jgi:two-component system NtrC family response regulator